VLRAVSEWGDKHDDPLSDEDLGRAVVQALALAPADYALNPDADYGAKRKIEKALRDAVAYRVYADLQRGWKITMPNLEQTGQLVIGYDSISQIAADQALGSTRSQRGAGAAQRRARRARGGHQGPARRDAPQALHRDAYLTEERYDEIRRSSSEWLRAPWALNDERGAYAASCFPGKKPSAADASNLYLSGLSLYRPVAAAPQPVRAPEGPQAQGRRGDRPDLPAVQGPRAGRHPVQGRGQEPADRLPHPGLDAPVDTGRRGQARCRPAAGKQRCRARQHLLR
jgi:hypothetical protein